MNFWSVYENEKLKQGFGEGKLYIRSRNRINLSLSTVEEYGTTLEMNQCMDRIFNEAARYAVATEMTHDLFVSLYDVNTEHSILLRYSEHPDELMLQKIIAQIKRIKNPNLEMRVIGLQDSNTELLGAVDRLNNAFNPNLMEVDLFGNEMRHIVFDMKLGMSFNLLLLNRIYGPHELVNAMTIEEFNKRKSELKFV